MLRTAFGRDNRILGSLAGNCNPLVDEKAFRVHSNSLAHNILWRKSWKKITRRECLRGRADERFWKRLALARIEMPSRGIGKMIQGIPIVHRVQHPNACNKYHVKNEGSEESMVGIYLYKYNIFIKNFHLANATPGANTMPLMDLLQTP